ncbi:MAG: RNA-binding protein [Bdellovibrio sp.]|nr:RNA-binding protein [Bdellovibrio sp.]
MGTKLYVGNLSYSTTDQGLTDLFSQAGTVTSAKVVTDRETGRSKGFGFVEMSTDEEAQAAVEKFNGQELEGRQLKVDEARPATNGGGPRGGGRGPRGGGGGYGGGGGRGGGGGYGGGGDRGGGGYGGGGDRGGRRF